MVDNGTRGDDLVWLEFTHLDHFIRFYQCDVGGKGGVRE